MKSILILLTLFTSVVFAQTKKIKSFKVSERVVSAAVDRAGDFYVVLKSGVIEKFDKDGEKLATYNGKPNLTSFDPTNAIRLLTYYMDDHRYTWLSPSLENPIPELLPLDPSWAVEPSLICISGDQDLWILDKADWNLKKINPRQSTTLTEFSITKEIPAPQITVMKEYLHFIFLINAEKEIFVYNSMGRMLRKFEVSNLHSLNFLGEELYYQQGNTIHFFDLYTAEKRTLPLSTIYNHILLTDERMFTVSKENQIEIFEFKP
jgi:hypothetical protein